MRTGQGMGAASVTWRGGTVGNTTPLHTVPLKHDAERYLGAEARGEINEREREKRGERQKKYFLNKNDTV